MVFFLNCYQITIEKLFAKITTVYKKPQGILLKLTLENLEISGNFVLEIGWTPCIYTCVEIDSLPIFTQLYSLMDRNYHCFYLWATSICGRLSACYYTEVPSDNNSLLCSLDVLNVLVSSCLCNTLSRFNLAILVIFYNH